MVLTVENRKYIAEQVDVAIVAKGMLELIDGYIARIALNVIDNLADKKLTIADSVKEKLNSVVDAIRSGDAGSAEELVADIANSIIDIPEVEEEDEKLIFQGAVKIIVGALKKAISKLKS
jgi:hypothetical protein